MTKELFQSEFFKKGIYYIGDLCYVMGNSSPLWDEFLKITEETIDGQITNYADGFYEFKGYKMGWHSTESGDGFYRASQAGSINNIASCPVDSGTIGIIPFSFIKMYNTQQEVEEIMTCGIVHSFENDFEVTLSYNSDFGRIVVYTRADDEDEDEYDEWEEEEEENDEERDSDSE
jgi:hypothetical protein